jgi:tetratricopeptide (TPR) repeat protein
LTPQTAVKPTKGGAAACFGFAWLSLLGAPAALALNIEYSADRPAGLAACDGDLYRGRSAEARRCYTAVLDGSEDPRIMAEASRSLGDVKAANSYFQAAIKRYPNDSELRARWGELFLQTHQDAEAVKLFQESLELDPGYLPAKLGLAEVSAGRFEDRARAWVGEVLEKAPRNLRAHLLLARMDLEEGETDRADERLDKALEIAQADGAPPLQIYALKASVDLMRGVTDSPWTQRALGYNPRYGGIYELPAHFYIITRRYREAIDLLQKAVTVEPDLYSAQSELGINLLRENRVEEAQQHLALAYRGDPYSPQIVNTLRLIDSFDHFRFLEHASDPEDPGTGAGIDLRLDEKEAAVLEPYVLKLVRSSIKTFSERYRFELKQPVVVELYPEPDDFAVRTSGLPGIGLLGVTFGYLVAMDSPSGRPEPDYHWGTTLWHEMAHVFTLESTHHLVPRWFSEGVSVFEEWTTGPLPGRHIPLTVLQAMKDDKFLPVAELDRGFIRPSYPSQIIVSYMQAGLACQYIAGQWGQQGIVAMLDAFREGSSTTDAIRSALGVSPQSFDSGFAAFVEDEFGPVLASFDDWRARNQQAAKALQAEDWAGAADAAQAAIELYPQYVAEGSPYLIEARAREELGRRADATETLRRYRSLGGHDPEALNELADWLQGSGEREEAIAVLEDVLLVAPLDPSLHTKLGDCLLEAGRPREALAEYQALMAMHPQDEAAAHYRLAKAYFALDDKPRSREHLLYALEIAPHYRDAQQLLLEVVR